MVIFITTLPEKIMNTLATVLLSNLRRKDLNRGMFRYYASQLNACLAQQTAELLSTKKEPITTPMGKAEATIFNQDIILVPILRSGLVLIPAFIQTFPEAKIGCIGLRRDEKTAKPMLYYNNMPKLNGKEQIIMLDPMIATGGSSTATLDILTRMGISQEQIIFVAVIASQEGIDYVKKAYPNITILVTAIDKELNKNKFIVPGLGDFGDRYFGTE
jgi:uracil phosphoribosyltransferase